jgi:hypothetical protein
MSDRRIRRNRGRMTLNQIFKDKNGKVHSVGLEIRVNAGYRAECSCNFRGQLLVPGRDGEEAFVLRRAAAEVLQHVKELKAD